jgi:hypothetical protein
MADLPDYMHSFADDAGKDSKDPNSPPNCIRGEDLDGNYAACLPIQDDGPNAPYKVEADSDGWKLKGQLVLDICENGRPRKIRVFGQKIGSADIGGGVALT